MTNRRDFLQKMTLGAGVLLTQPRIERLFNPKEKLGVALVGLGNYSLRQLAPALLETQHCRLTGIVTGSPEKVPE